MQQPSAGSSSQPTHGSSSSMPHSHTNGHAGPTANVPRSQDTAAAAELVEMEKQRITPQLIQYVENFKFPFINDVSCYEKQLKIGQGTFGEVFKAKCKKTGRIVALKKILMENEREGFPITALREIKMLQRLKYQHITELIEICSAKATARERSTFYLVFAFCEHDLAGLLSNPNVKFSIVHIKTLMKHLLLGLYWIHEKKILHRDMKAANVLISKEGILKLADFGLARPLIRQGGGEAAYTNRVVTLWYRPPELLLGERNYGPTIDIWGAGCIMAELWTRAPILQGDTEQRQLVLISNLCGSISTLVWRDVERLPLYQQFLGSSALPQGLPRRVVERLENYIKDVHALTLIDRLLQLDPSNRPSADDALDDTFFFTDPMAATDVKDLLKNIGGSLFEYTVGRGAHSNRGRGAQQGPSRAAGRPPEQAPKADQGFRDMIF